MLARLAAIAVLSLALSSQGSEAQQGPSLRFAGTTQSLTMDPHATNDFVTTSIFRQIYDSLVSVSPTMDPVPGLATAWTYRGDNTWRFTLRAGVRFHAGQSFSADDVVFSIMRQKDSRFYTALFGDIREVRRIDDLTVDVISNNPDPILPRKMMRMFIMSKAWVEANNAAAIPDLGARGAESHTVRNANGTGPMQLVSDEPGVRTVFRRNRAFWGPFPGNVEEAIYMPIGSGPTRVAALLSNQVDVVVDLPLQDMERVRANPTFKVEQTPQFSWIQLELDGTRDVALGVFDKQNQPLQANPFRDVRVRRAIAHAIDAQTIIDRILRGQSRPVGLAAVPGIGGYIAELDRRPVTDLARARQLLTEAGYPNGFVATLNCPLERYVNPEEVCRAIAGMLARVGIDIRVNGMVWPEFARMLVNGPASSFHLIGAGPNSWDSQDTFMQTMITRSTERREGFFNWALWTNPAFDAVARELTTTFDEARRTALFRRAFEIANDNVAGVTLYQQSVTSAMRSNISAPIRADATLVLQNVTVR